MTNVEAGVKTLQQGLGLAKELSMSIRNIVNAFCISELPGKPELQKMLNEADLQGRWHVYHGFCAIAHRKQGAFWKDSVQQELQVLLFSIEECIERSIDATDDPKELRRILRWTDNEEHPKTRQKLIKKLAASLLKAIPDAGFSELNWIKDEACLKDHIDFHEVVTAVNKEADKRALNYIEANSDSQVLLAVLDWNASYDTKRRAWTKALENTTVPEIIYSIAAGNRFGHEYECRAWDKFVDSLDDNDTHRLWIAVEGKYPESIKCVPRSKALGKLLSLDKSLNNLLRIDGYRWRCNKFPYKEMEQAFLDIIQSSSDAKMVKDVYENILEKNKGLATKVYEEVMLTAVRRLYELSQSN